MGRLVEMVVESVRVHMLSNRHVVILKDAERERYLPIWIGPWEASSIAMKLQGLTAERPLTHDLFTAALDGLGARIDRIVISELADETYHARLYVERGGEIVESMRGRPTASPWRSGRRPASSSTKRFSSRPPSRPTPTRAKRSPAEAIRDGRAATSSATTVVRCRSSRSARRSWTSAWRCSGTSSTRWTRIPAQVNPAVHVPAERGR